MSKRKQITVAMSRAEMEAWHEFKTASRELLACTQLLKHATAERERAMQSVLDAPDKGVTEARAAAIKARSLEAERVNSFGACQAAYRDALTKLSAAAAPVSPAK